MGVKLSRSMNAKSSARDMPDRLTGGVLPVSGRICDTPEAAAQAEGEAAKGDEIAGIIKGVTAVATLATMA